MEELLVREIHEETSRLERLHGVKFDDQALLLAAYVAMHPRNQSVGETRERAIGVLTKACKTKDNMHIHQKQLHKLKYSLRRALVEFKQLIKENNVDGSSGDSWVSQVEKELKDAFIDLVMFVKKRMCVKHDDFVFCVHEAERIQDYSYILHQVDARVYEKFKETLVIGVQEIAVIASNLTGIPASWFSSKPEERYRSLGERLRKRVFGQDQAIEAITEALLKPKAESSWSGRPLGSFLLAGPYAVGGRTEFVKAIASEVYDDDEDRLIKIDMEKYREPHSASCLVDSLTHSVKNKPYSVLLFDRIEKAHACVINTLLSILSKNNSIDFRNTLIILTSDVEEEAMHAPILGPGFEDAKKSIKHELVELLDKTIMVNWRCPLKDIARLLLREWASKSKKAVIVCPSDSALTQIALKAAREEGADGKGVERWVEERVFPVLSSLLIVHNQNQDQDHPNPIAENYITLYIDTVEGQWELAFNLDYNN